MRISYIELAGQKFPLCFSLSATEEMLEEFGSLEAMTETLDGDDTLAKLRAVDRVLDILLRAGRRYCETMGLEQPPALKGAPSDVIDIADPSAIAAIFSTISSDNKRTVEAKQSKKERPRREG